MKVEDRLEQAGRELRDSTRHLQPPPLTKQKVLARGWLVFAGVFLVVAIGLGVLPLLVRSNSEQAPLATPATVATTIPSELSTGAPSTAPVAQCSASGMPAPGDQEGLPAEVAQARTAIAAAAISCDLAALHSLAGELLTSFGGGDFSSIQEWEDSGEGKLATLVQLFDTRYAVQEFAGEPTIYVWPAAFAYDSWEEIPEEDIAELTEIFGEEEMELIAEFGAYAGWRIGISEDGDWRFFIAGD